MTTRRLSASSGGSLPSLSPPELDAILARKRRLHHRVLHFALPPPIQAVLTCFSISASAVLANGVYVWPTYGPVVQRRLGLGGTEAQTIVVGGILGVYLMAAPLGSVTDRLGPRIGSLISAGLAAAGYYSFAFILDRATPWTPYVHAYLTGAYFLVGSATVGSYFAALTCASLSFPSHPTLSLSVPLALISLSSLFLSSFSALPIFQTRTGTPGGDSTDLDAAKYLIFLGTLCLAVNLFSAVFMRILPTPGISLATTTDEPLAPGSGPVDDEEALDEPHSPMSQLLHLDEHTPLLIGGPEAAREDAEDLVRGKERWTAARLLRDWGGFWVFGILLALCIGPSETVIASIGSILTSLLPPTTSSISITSLSTNSSSPPGLLPLPSSLTAPFLPTFLTLPLSTLASTTPSQALLLRNKHVSLLSLTGTLSRLLTGLLADHLAPPLTPIAVPHDPARGHTDLTASLHIYVQRRPVRLLRTSFNAVCALMLAGVFAWSAGWLESERGLWVLSAGTGVMYGALFTLTPAIVSAHFGPTSFGLAWGMISYFAAIGAIIFSYLYAYISTSMAAHPDRSGMPGASLSQQDPFTQDQPPACFGTKCFSLTLWVAAGCCVISGLGMFGIGKRWNV